MAVLLRIFRSRNTVRLIVMQQRTESIATWEELISRKLLTPYALNAEKSFIEKMLMKECEETSAQNAKTR